MLPVSAQVSLYPLRREHLSPAIEAVLEVFRRHGLEVKPGAMSTLLTGDGRSVFGALGEAFCRVAEEGDVTMVVTISNACPIPVNKAAGS